MSRVALRPLALPPEHGAWAFLLEPIAVGLLVAPSKGGAFIAFGAVAAFLARHPLLLALRDHKSGKRYPRTAICERLALGYATLAAIAFAQVETTPLLVLIASLPLAVVHFVNAGRSLSAELAGAIAPAASVASIAIAARQPWALAVALWVLLAARAIVSTLYVRTALRGESRALMLGAHVAAVLIALALAYAQVIAFGAVAAMFVLLLRALPRPSLMRASARAIGMREVAYGVVMVALLAL
jgi:hypothetical protein